METPINHLFKLLKEYPDKPLQIINLLNDYMFELVSFEKEFTKSVYRDALINERVCTLKEAEIKAEEYYINKISESI